MRQPQQITDFFGHGQTLESQLDDEHLAAELDYQQWALADLRLAREARAYDEACAQAIVAGHDEPTPDMVRAFVRMFELVELDAAPNWQH